MATVTLIFQPHGAVQPDGTADNIAAAIVTYKSTGLAPTNGCQPFDKLLQYPMNQKSSAIFKFKMPSGYGSGGTCRINVFSPATTGVAYFYVSLLKVTPGVGNRMDNVVFQTPTCGIFTPSGTSTGLVELVIEPAAGGVAYKDHVRLMITRNGALVEDNVNDNVYITDMNYEYASS